MSTILKVKKKSNTFRKEKLYAALEVAGMALWEFNVQTEETIFNDTWYTILGYKPLELPMEMTTFYSLVHPEDLGPLTQAAENFDHSQPNAVFEAQYRVKHKSGEWIWCRNRSTVELDENGKPLLWLGSVFNINHLKDSEREAVKNHEHLNAVVNSLSDIIFESDSEFNLLNVWVTKNHPDAELINSFQGKNLKNVYSQRKFNLFKSFISNTLKTNQPQEYLYHSPTLDHHYLARATPICKEGQKPNAVTIVIQDVTEIQRAQNTLKKNQANLNAIIQNTSDVFWAIDQSEKLIVFNQAFSDLLFDISGLRPKMGKRLNDSFLMAETAKRWRHIHSRSLRGLDTTFSKSLYFTDGKVRLFEFHINPYKNDTGEIIGSVVTGRDIDDLYSAKKQAEKAARLKSKFVSTISHEIRTPLNAILGTCHQLVKANTQQNLADDIDILQMASDNLLNLINDVLDFTKLESGKTNVTKTSIDFPDFLRSMSQFQNKLSENKGLNFSFIQSGHIPDFVVTDKTKLHQILTNIISNAIKYTNAGNIGFRVHGKKMKNGLSILEFEITDTGIGIPQKEISGIFDSFTQSSTSYNLLKGGTGLGLAITKNLVKLLEGNIWVTSEIDKGSTFKCAFTFDTQKPQLRIPNFSPTGNSKSKIKVLVAEDNEINAKIITRLLGQWNIDYDLAPNGRIAFQHALKKSYHLILMDIQMPEMNGYEASYKIKKEATLYNKNTPIIALTAQPDFSYDQNYQEGIFTSSILKPFHPESLKSTIFSQIKEAV